jgi:hypothetical protein
MENTFDIHKWQAKHLTKLVKENRQVKEVTGAGLQRLDGMVHRGLLKDFLEAFDEIHSDLILTGEEFPAIDLIEFLSQEMQRYAEDTRMDRE